ncbi:MAG: sigma-54 dependent transcriptional regulator [Phycisphaerae bacterium]
MGNAGFVLILTQNELQGERLRELLRATHGHSCLVVTSLEDAFDSIRARQPDAVVADATIAGRETGKPLRELLDALSRDAALLIVGAGDVPAGASNIALPTDLEPAALAERIDAQTRKAVQRREDRLFQASLDEQKVEQFEGLVGSSPQIKRIVSRILKAAPTKVTVLIVGETGTGKELIAKAIHRRSPRARRPFLAVNCSAVSETLLESELFGHVRGAFTGAVSDRKGLFVAADGGTIFLDEIGDMPLAMQPKLLRVLGDSREVTPVGSTEVRKVDVRVVAATNADLARLVDEKKFREDLLYRLKAFEIDVPPLRERRQDVPPLARHLLEQANREHGQSVTGISAEALQHLVKYYWRGNIRELRSVIESLVVEVGDRRIEADDLPEEIRGSRELVPASSGGLVGLTMEQVERMMIERTLQATQGNREQAAKMLNIGTRTLYRKIKDYGL